MPFPATGDADPEGGRARDQGSRAAPRADPQIGGLFRGRDRADGPVHSRHLFAIRGPDVRRRPQEVGAPSPPGQADGGNPRPRPLSPCPAAGATAAPVSPLPHPGMSAALLAAAGPDRAGVEARPTPGHPQPGFRHAGRAAGPRRRLLQSMEKTESSAAQIRLHDLRRYV